MDEKELVEHACFLQNLARRLLSDEHFAQDVVQEAYLAARRAGQPRNVRAWLGVVTRNLSLRVRRREAGRRARERAAARPEEQAAAADDQQLEVPLGHGRSNVPGACGAARPHVDTLVLQFDGHEQA